MTSNESLQRGELPDPHTFNFLSGSGEMGRRVRAFDWAQTPLGAPEAWPEGLKAAVRILMHSRFPMFVWWGPELTKIYNDAYIPVLGPRHAQALGRPASEVWPDIWPAVGPQTDVVLRENRATWNESMLLMMERYGYKEETYFTFSYSPIPNDDGGVGGIFGVCTDDTQRVIGQRQLALLRELATVTTEARTWREVCRRSAAVLQPFNHDLPFALIYVGPASESGLVLAGAVGIEPGHHAAPTVLSRKESASWPVHSVFQSNNVVVVHDLPTTAAGLLPTGAWSNPPSSAAIVPIAAAGHTGHGGVLIVGLSPFRQFDDDYRNFLTLVAGRISAGIARAQAYEEEKERAQALAEREDISKRPSPLRRPVPFAHPRTGDTRSRILCADDNADMRDSISRILGDRFELEMVADGQAALQAARRRPPDLVLSDVMTPTLDGVGLLRELRADAELKRIPVILLSARAGEEAAIEGVEAGADEYLVKPFSARELLARVESAIKLARLRDDMSRALQDSETRISAIVEGQSEMVCRFRPDGTILFVNGAYARARGATPDELLTSNFWNFIEEADRPSVRALLDRLTPESPEIRIENRFETTEGVRWTLWTNRALAFDELGRASELQSAGIDITERKRAEEALRQLNETLEQRVQQRTAQVHELASRLSMAQQEERRYIAQILHDDLQQLLYGIEMKLTMIREDLQTLARPDLVRTLDEGYGWIEQAISAARQLTVELSPPILQDEGLADALEWLQRQMRDLHRMEVNVRAEHNFFLEDQDLHVLLFQIVRELLFNVKKHAGVNQATVRLLQVERDLVIQVSDHGRGFDVQTLGARGEKAGGFGLFSIRERLNLIGGRLEVRSQPGDGTFVEARAPVTLRRAP